MSVDNPNVIDFISEQDDDKVVLTISDHLEWDDEDNNHLYLLQEKVNAYLSALESGQVDKAFPSAIGRKPIISVIMKYEPNESGKLFLSMVDETLSNAGYEFEYQVFEDSE